MNSFTDQDTSTLPPSTPEKAVAPTPATNGNAARKEPMLIKRMNKRFMVKKGTFITTKADTGEYHSKFRILPYSRASNRKYSGSADKLAQYIKDGGGLVVDSTEGQLSPHDVIKILDVEYVRANIKETQDMVLPYDCFSSSFIWNQIYQRSLKGTEKQDADLNMYRISPSAHVCYDANGIFHGAITWEDIQPISSDKLSPAIRIKDFALQFFPELIVCLGSSRSRRVYTRQESQDLLDKICEVDGHDRVLGVSLYQKISDDYFPNRTSLSLKEHFRKTILPHVLADDGYYTVGVDDLVKFQMVVDKEGRMNLRGIKRARGVEDD